MNITPTQSVAVTITPDWQPVNTIPKDGSVVRIATQHGGFKKPEHQFQYTDVFWGKMSAFPDSEDVWVSVKNPDNGLYCDNEFIRETHIYSNYGVESTNYLYRGARIIGWTRPWEVQLTVKYPDVDPPQVREVVYDNRKDRTAK